MACYKGYPHVWMPVPGFFGNRVRCIYCGFKKWTKKKYAY